MSVVHRFPYDIHAGFHFCRAAGVVFVKQRRVAAYLAQPRQLRQNADSVLAKRFFRRVFQAVAQLLYMSVVQLFLLRIHFGDNDIIQLFGQLVQNVRFQTAQYKRRNHAAQPRKRGFVPVAYNRYLKFVAEPLIIVQKTGHKIVEYAPKLAETVFYRRSGKGKARFCAYSLDRLCALCKVVLDVLCLIDYLKTETDVAVKLRVAL